MVFELIEEFKLDVRIQEQIRVQLKTCFGDSEFDKRIYFKQRAHYRLLLKNEDKLIGQMGLDYRAMFLGDEAIQVLGLIDFTVDPKFQGKGYGTKMLKELDQIALQFDTNIDFLLLAADTHKVYLNNGFKRLKQKVKWLGFHKHQTTEIITRDTDFLMIKPLGKKQWRADALLDMMGYMY